MQTSVVPDDKQHSALFAMIKMLFRNMQKYNRILEIYIPVPAVIVFFIIFILSILFVHFLLSFLFQKVDTEIKLSY